MLKLEKPKDNFTIVCNEPLRDKRISLRAKGLYALTYSKPTDWRFYEAALMEESTEGRDAVRGAMKELIEAGWVSKRQPRGDRGCIVQTVICLHLSAAWKSVDGSTVDGESASTNTDNTKTEELTPSVSPSQETPTKDMKRGRASAISLDEFFAKQRRPTANKL